MTLIAQHTCCSLLGIDPKTLRRWLAQVQIPFLRSPTDARCRCLTPAHIQYLATIHDRPLAPSCIMDAQHAQIEPSDEVASLPSFQEAANPSVGHPASLEAAALSEQIFHLQQVVATLQEQLTQLACDFLHERTRRDEHEQQVAFTLLSSPAQSRARTSLTTASTEPTPSSSKEARSHPSKGRPRSIIPLIEYVGNDSYMIISPSHGELRLRPESREWFAWLSTLSSFRFIGQHGRLSTYRKQGRSGWLAYRRLHGRRCEFSLGSTDQITIAHLEHMARILQSPNS